MHQDENISISSIESGNELLTSLMSSLAGPTHEIDTMKNHITSKNPITFSCNSEIFAGPCGIQELPNGQGGWNGEDLLLVFRNATTKFQPSEEVDAAVRAASSAGDEAEMRRILANNFQPQGRAAQHDWI